MKIQSAFQQFTEKERTVGMIRPFKDLRWTPLNVDFGKLTNPLIGSDDLRPIMSGNHFDLENKIIEGTNGFVVYRHPMPPSVIKDGTNGVYLTIQKLEKQYRTSHVAGHYSFEEYKEKYHELFKVHYTARFPNISAVIKSPEERNMYTTTLDLQKLHWYVSVLLKAEHPNNDKSKLEKGKFLDYQKIGQFRYKVEGVTYIQRFNCGLIRDVCRYWLRQGVEHIEASAHLSLDSTVNIGEFKNPDKFGKVYIIGMTSFYMGSVENNNFTLTMPVVTDSNVISDEFEPFNAENGFSNENAPKGADGLVSVYHDYYDLDTNRLFIGNEDNPKGLFIEIDQDMGYKGSAKKKVGTESISKRIKGLEIALRVTKDSQGKSKIQKRLDGLRLSMKILQNK